MNTEAQTLQERLSEMRAHVLKTLNDMDAPALNWQPTPKDTNSVFVLATHLAGSERFWLHEVVGGRKIARDRDAEFRARGEDVAALRAMFDEIARDSDAILSQLDAAEMDATRDAARHGGRTVRWCILHTLEHYCEHLGHIQLTQQLWEAREKSNQ